MDKTVFFTVAKTEKPNYRSQALLEILSRTYRANIVVMTRFDPERDEEEVRGMTALVDRAVWEFTGAWQKVSADSPGLPSWARLAKGRAIIGPKAVTSPAKLIHCARMLVKHFPNGYQPEGLAYNRINVSKR